MRVRGIVRPLLLIALVALIASEHVAEAGFDGKTERFGGLLQGLMGQVTGMINQVTQTMTQNIVKKFSVLSGFFGEGATRESLSLPEIFSVAFSRNNNKLSTSGTTVNMDFSLGSGGGVLAAVSSGGSVSVSTTGGTVSVTTETSGDSNEPAGSDDGSSDSSDSSDSGEPGDSSSDSDEPEGDTTVGGGEEASTPTEPTPSPEDSSPNSTAEDPVLDKAVIDLMSDWDAFVTSDIWDSQDGEPQPSAEAEVEEDEALPTTQRVINGVFLGNKYAAGAPFSVRFFYNNEENFYCSGSLIAYHYVLTAAHCGVVVGDEVRVGGRLLRSGFKATVKEVITHPDFKPDSLAHDVAIVKLDGLPGRKKLNKNGVMAARLNKKKKFPPRKFVGVVSGHGSVATDGRGVSDELQSTRHIVYRWDKCKKEITQGDLKRHDSYMCAGDGVRSTTCVGDSGAGMWRFVNKGKDKKKQYYEIFGVVSFGEVTDEYLCPRGPPTVFQKTAKNYGWIKRVVGKKRIP